MRIHLDITHYKVGLVHSYFFLIYALTSCVRFTSMTSILHSQKSKRCSRCPQILPKCGGRNSQLLIGWPDDRMTCRFCKSLRLRISSILRTYVVRSYDQITQHNAKKYRKGKHHTTRIRSMPIHKWKTIPLVSRSQLCIIP